MKIASCQFQLVFLLSKWGDMMFIQSKNLYILVLTYVLSSFLLATVVVFAWFAISDHADASFLVETSDLSVDYELYVYKSPNHLGSPTPTLNNNICSTSSETNCYLRIENPESIYLIGDERPVIPNDRFSYAIKMTNNSSENISLDIDFIKVTSTGFDFPFNKVQTSFSYAVTRISYAEILESADIKDNGTIEYAGQDPLITHYFSDIDDETQNLASFIPLEISGNQKTVIIFFDLHFDPWVWGKDEFGQSTGNSNAFQNQVMIIERIFLRLNPI
jgi:hypothetical protein